MVAERCREWSRLGRSLKLLEPRSTEGAGFVVKIVAQNLPKINGVRPCSKRVEECWKSVESVEMLAKQARNPVKSKMNRKGKMHEAFSNMPF